MKKIIVEHVSIIDTVEDVDPPSPDPGYDYKTLHDWLKTICASERPEKPIAYYEAELFESEHSRVLCLVGMNKSNSSKKIVFQPRNMYYNIPPGEFKDLSSEQLDNKIIDEFRDFTKTKYFTNTYLAQSDSILYRGKSTIWSKP